MITHLPYNHQNFGSNETLINAHLQLSCVYVHISHSFNNSLILLVNLLVVTSTQLG